MNRNNGTDITKTLRSGVPHPDRGATVVNEKQRRIVFAAEAEQTGRGGTSQGNL